MNLAEGLDVSQESEPKAANTGSQILDLPLVSIIVPTKNSSKTLFTCLRSITNQAYSNVEIIIVDGNSSDDTLKIAKEFAAIVLSASYERAKAKNFAMHRCHGKYVCFIDSDMELSNGVIEECVRTITRDSRIAGVIIPERSIGKGYWVKVRDFERSLYRGTEIESARFFNRELAISVGGFDESIVFYEESTLPQRIQAAGFTVQKRISSIILHHEPYFSLFRWLKKKYYYGGTAKHYAIKYRMYAQKQTSISYRLSILLRNGRWSLLWKMHLTLGVFLLKTLEFLATFASNLFHK